MAGLRYLPLMLMFVAPPGLAGSTFVALGEEIVELVREEFVDARTGARWAERHSGYASAASTAEEFSRLTHLALAELTTSHTSYLPKHSVENLQLRSLFGLSTIEGTPVAWSSIGVDTVELSDGWFVRHVFAEGPAARAGILRGDRLLRADGEPFHPVGSFEEKAGQPVQLTVQRERDASPFVVAVTPQQIAPRDEWIAYQKASSAVVDLDGRQIAYQHVYSCAGAEPLALLRRTLAEEFALADALVIDFRDGLGGCGPDFLDLFNPLAPTLVSVDRQGRETVWPSAWHKPVVLLVNDNSRSGKELVAAAFRRHRVGTLVGEPTPGAVLMGRAFPLRDGGLLYLAVQEVRVDDERLEGVGVAVDFEVPSSLAYAAGRDEQREQAITVAARRPDEHQAASP